MSQDKANNLFDQMAFDIIYTLKNGKVYREFLRKQLEFPVMPLGKDRSYGDFNEGRNDFIRNIINGAERHVEFMKREGKPQNVKRTRKAT